MKIDRLLMLVVMVALTLPHDATAGLVFGGGPAKSDCYAAFDVVGVTSAKANRVVKCNDGSACDTDGTADGRCKFSFTVCVLQTGDASCQPPDVTKIRKKGVLLPTIPATAAACGPANEATVKVKRHKTVNLIAHSSGKPKSDHDILQLQCRPSSPSGAFLEDVY